MSRVLYIKWWRFAEQFQQLLNPVGVDEVVYPETQTYVPVLDDPISEAEVFDEITRMSQDKAPGTDGIPVGTFRYLPDQWIWLLTFLLNMIFLGTYPRAWCLASFSQFPRKCWAVYQATIEVSVFWMHYVSSMIEYLTNALSYGLNQI